jgi:hypothetical protein
MKKVLITGNRNYGLCEAICNLFDTVDYIDYRTISRGDGFYLDKDEDQQKVADLFVNDKYDIFINNAALWKFHQVMLAEKVHNTAQVYKHPCHLIHMGSTADTGVKGRTWRYPTEKKALKAYNRDLTYLAQGGSNIKSTIVSPGSLTTPSVIKKHPDRALLDVEYIAKVILWLIEQPDYVNINEISLDPIQNGIFAKER